MQYLPHQAGRDVEGDTGEYFVSTRADREREKISANDLDVIRRAEPLAQASDKRRVLFDRDDPFGPSCQLGRDYARARADLVNGIRRPDIRHADQIGDQLRAFEKILPEGNSFVLPFIHVSPPWIRGETDTPKKSGGSKPRSLSQSARAEKKPRTCEFLANSRPCHPKDRVEIKDPGFREPGWRHDVETFPLFVRGSESTCLRAYWFGVFVSTFFERQCDHRTASHSEALCSDPGILDTLSASGS